MSWTRTAGKVAAKYGVRYGPHAVAAWKVAGPKVEAAARARLDEGSARRTAFDHAGSVAAGSVLRVVEKGQGVFVVFSADEPVAAYPEVERPLAELVARADLGRRVTPEERRRRQLRNRVRRGRLDASSQDATPDQDR